jgi:hypothetical protein
MPKALEEKNGYQFSFYSSDCSEPPHVHVTKAGSQAKFWLFPRVELAVNRGFKQQEIDEVRGIMIGNKWTIWQNWKKFCGTSDAIEEENEEE